MNSSPYCIHYETNVKIGYRLTPKPDKSPPDARRTGSRGEPSSPSTALLIKHLQKNAPLLSRLVVLGNRASWLDAGLDNATTAVDQPIRIGCSL